MNSRKFISKIVHSLTPAPLKTPAPGTLHSPAPVPLATPMDRYARSWMFFLQTNVCASERTPQAPALMLQVARRGYAELLRNPISRSSSPEEVLIRESLLSQEELIHLRPALALIAFLGCVDVLLRRVRTLAPI